MSSPGFQLSLRDIGRLTGVHPDLVRVIELTAARSTILFVVTEGVRAHSRQVELVKAGKSKTMRSRHLPESNACKQSCAVDLAVWEDRDNDKVVDVDEISWKFPQYKALADVVKAAADELGIEIEWGGDWSTFKDGPHFQLPWSSYP
jgi:peptidoglycan LD-endopeptidase CwlK